MFYTHVELNLNTERIPVSVKAESEVDYVDLAWRVSQFVLAGNVLRAKGNLFRKFRSLHFS